MSFGISIGDLLAVSKLLRTTLSSLRRANEAGAAYNDLVSREIGVLESVLKDVPPDQSDSVRLAAAGCKGVLDDFLRKLKKYQSLENGAAEEGEGERDGNGARKRRKLVRAGRKLQWGFTIEKDVDAFRRKLAPQLMCLHVALATAKMAETSLREKPSRIQQDIAENEDESQERRSDTIEDTPRLINLINSFAINFKLQLDSLVQTTREIFTTQLEILSFLSKYKDGIPPPDTRYTWAQAPVKFEDAFGRILPIPSEYNWSKIEAIIQDQFADQPGCNKVQAKEYVLFRADDPSLKLSTEGSLSPGSSVTMAMIIGMYETTWNGWCPRPGCRSREFSRPSTGSSVCTTHLPLPLRLEDLAFAFFTSPKMDRSPTDRKRKRSDSGREQAFEALHHLRTERLEFKNVSICLGGVREFQIWKSQKERATAGQDLYEAFKKAVQGKWRIAETIVELICEVLGHVQKNEVVESLESLTSLGFDSLHAAHFSYEMDKRFDIDMSVWNIIGPGWPALGRIVRRALTTEEEKVDVES